MNNISYYSNALSKPTYQSTLNEMLRGIKEELHKHHVQELAKIKDPELRRKYKANKVPAFTVSGSFSEKKADSLIKHSGFIAIDFDQIEDLDTFKAELYADPYTYAGFKSISGAGACIIVKIKGNKHLESYEALEKYYYTKYGAITDPSCKNINRLRFVSSDPELHLNQDALVFEDYLPKRKGKPPKLPQYISTDEDINHVAQQAATRGIDMTSEYSDWVAIGMAIYSELGEAGEHIFQTISQNHPDYDHRKTSRKYRSFKGQTKVSIATLFYHAKKNGISPITKETEYIGLVAQYAKSDKRSREQVSEQLEKMDGIKPEKSKEIIDQIFDSNIKIESEDGIVSDIEHYILTQCSIKFNDLSLKYEIDGEEMKEREFNSIFLNCKKVHDKTTIQLFQSVVNSDRIPSYNPVLDFFKENTTTKKGLMEKLSDTIETPTGLGESNDFEFARYFIRKWMIGAVAMWHGDVSPLLLLLAGRKQNTGKTYFINHLLPKALIQYVSTTVISSDKDFLFELVSKLIVVDDEFEGKSKLQIEAIKRLCSTEYFSMRRPYGRTNESFKRVAALAATSNNPQVLSDNSGNRRIIVIEVDSINHEAYNKIDKVELWCEAFNAYKNGESHHLTSDDVRRLNASSEDYNETSQEEELIDKFICPPNTAGITENMTTTDIQILLENNSNLKLSLKKIGTYMQKVGHERKVKSIDGTKRRVYEIVRKSI